MTSPSATTRATEFQIGRREASLSSSLPAPESLLASKRRVLIGGRRSSGVFPSTTSTEATSDAIDAADTTTASAEEEERLQEKPSFDTQTSSPSSSSSTEDADQAKTLDDIELDLDTLDLGIMSVGDSTAASVTSSEEKHPIVDADSVTGNHSSSTEALDADQPHLDAVETPSAESQQSIVSSSSSSSSSSSEIETSSSSSSALADISESTVEDTEAALLDQVDLTPTPHASSSQSSPTEPRSACSAAEKSSREEEQDAASLLDQVDLDVLPVCSSEELDGEASRTERPLSPDPAALLAQVDLAIPEHRQSAGTETAESKDTRHSDAPEDLLDQLVLPIEPEPTVSSSTSSSSSSSSTFPLLSTSPTLSNRVAATASSSASSSSSSDTLSFSASAASGSDSVVSLSEILSRADKASASAAEVESARTEVSSSSGRLRGGRIESHAIMSTAPSTENRLSRVVSHSHLHERYNMFDLDAEEEEEYILPDREVILKRIGALFAGLRDRFSDLQKAVDDIENFVKQAAGNGDDLHNRQIAKLVRGPLTTALARLLTFGLRRTTPIAPSSWVSKLFSGFSGGPTPVVATVGASSSASGSRPVVHSVWEIICTFNEGRASVHDVESLSLSRAILSIQQDHKHVNCPHRSLRAWVCCALNTKCLGSWIRVLASSENVRALYDAHLAPNNPLILFAPAVLLVEDVLAPLRPLPLKLSLHYEFCVPTAAQLNKARSRDSSSDSSSHASTVSSSSPSPSASSSPSSTESSASKLSPSSSSSPDPSSLSSSSSNSQSTTTQAAQRTLSGAFPTSSHSPSSCLASSSPSSSKPTPQKKQDSFSSSSSTFS